MGRTVDRLPARPCMARGRWFLLLLPLLFASPWAAGATVADDSTKEIWPEMDLWYRLSPSWRATALIPLSWNPDTHYSEGGFTLQADYVLGRSKSRYFSRKVDENRVGAMKPYLARLGYAFNASLGDRGETNKEAMLFGEFHLRIPFQGNILISHRLRIDERWIGDSHDNSYRIRYRIMSEREWVFNKVSVVPYFSAEPSYDSRYETVNRVRAIGGASVSWTPRTALEGNVTYQYDSRSSVTQLLALNLILHVFFEAKPAAQN